MTDTSHEIRSEITSDGNLKLSLESVEKPEPKDGEVLIKIEASPINPSDLGLLLGPADISTLKVSEGIAQMKVPESLIRSVNARLNQSLPVGNEGAGVVEFDVDRSSRIYEYARRRGEKCKLDEMVRQYQNSCLWIFFH